MSQGRWRFWLAHLAEPYSMRGGSNDTGLAGAKYRQIMAGSWNRVDQEPVRFWPGQPPTKGGAKHLTPGASNSPHRRTLSHKQSGAGAGVRFKGVDPSSLPPMAASQSWRVFLSRLNPTILELYSPKGALLAALSPVWASPPQALPKAKRLVAEHGRAVSVRRRRSIISMAVCGKEAII